MSTFSCPIVTVKTVTPNTNADSLDILTFEEIAWVCQDVRGKREVGDKVVYIPIDAMVDCSRSEFKFLEKNAKMRHVAVSTVPSDIVEGATETIMAQRPIARIKTIKLRGEISQGLVIDCPSDIEVTDVNCGVSFIVPSTVGTDAAFHFGITKYEPPQEAVFSANAKGSFPSWCPKTDAERYQNVNRTLEPYVNDLYTVSVKVDGTSMTVFYDSLREGDVYGVCSRNQELRSPDQDVSSSVPTKYGFAMDSYWKATVADDLLHKAEAIAMALGYQRVALQCELAGEGIQKNTMGLKGQQAFLFDIYATKEGFEGYVDHGKVLQLAEEYQIRTVPILWKSITLTQMLGDPIDFTQIHSMKYQNGHPIEGVVWVSLVEKQVGRLGRLKFKYINSNYLLLTEIDE